MSIEKFSSTWNTGHLPALKEYLQDRPHNALFRGIDGSSDALVLSELFECGDSTVLTIVENNKAAETLAQECTTFLDQENVLVFPTRDAVPYNMKSPFGPTVETRFSVLSELLNGEKRLIIAPYSSLMQRIIPGRALFNSIIRIETGVELSVTDLAQWLTDSGFHREDQVNDLGTFSIRGGILDIYPFMADNPYRIEFWGDTVESIREFDVFTQKSSKHKKGIEIFPMREFRFSEAQIDSALQKMNSHAQENGADLSAVHKLEHQWKSIRDFEAIEWYLHWFDTDTVSVLDYLPGNATIVWDDLVPLERRLDECRQNYTRHIERVPEIFKPLVSPADKLLLSDSAIEDQFEFYTCIYIETLDYPKDTKCFSFSFTRQPELRRDLDSIIDTISAYYSDGYRCVIVSSNLGHGERLVELLGDKGSFIEVCTGDLQEGFICKDSNLLLYTENQIFNRAHRPLKKKKQKNAIPISSFDSLNPQDFVVHEDHGIGKFLGIERIKAAQTVSDCMVILYAENGKVYVPVEDFHKVQKYLGRESTPPTLSKLGSASWERLKKRTRESLVEMAQELIELYAKRQHLEGIPFVGDNLWQKEFEDSFIYEETPDQHRAIKEVKEDMESKKPMDRLVCGDVGFGKTEVAMRAAFKAVMSGYQVAVLAPTTILAAQHLSTFTERMSSFPVKLAGLSRFQSRREQQQAIEKLQSGDVDIVIGTHRIFSEDVKFKNLGLLIVDEEQRFGVKHKEKLKHFRYKVDVLSLTATPIPRTLHMSLVGARDLSIINTPPRNRLPIETNVSEYHDDLVKSAIETELQRGGQVYFVNNRIGNLPELQDKIEQLAPKARVISAHGQMNEHDLEMVMKEFIAGRYDVLLSTVIIENGLDIPNVNTIIVNRADTLGLSQLYQLRGRVGRSSEQAYAFLLTPTFKQIKDDSLKRLKALEQYTELGSGFQIAMRDLEIRGAGNLLGTRQHGFIAAVGFELYCKLLQEAVDEIKGTKALRSVAETKLEIPLEAYLPTQYIADGPTRIAVYQEISSAASSEEITEMEKTLSDRFGALPEVVRALILLIKIKICAQKIGSSRVILNNQGTLTFHLEGEEQDIKGTIEKIFKSNPGYNFELVYQTPISVKTLLLGQETAERTQEVFSIVARAAGEQTGTLCA